MIQKLIIEGELCDLNKYINSNRSNKYYAATIKKDETERVMWDIKINQLKKMQPPIFINFLWVAKDKRKDKDNIAFAKKFILDALEHAGVIGRDSWINISGWTDKFEIDADKPRIELEIIDNST